METGTMLYGMLIEPGVAGIGPYATETVMDEIRIMVGDAGIVPHETGTALGGNLIAAGGTIYFDEEKFIIY